jgi:hypothetical protein
MYIQASLCIYKPLYVYTSIHTLYVYTSIHTLYVYTSIHTLYVYTLARKEAYILSMYIQASLCIYTSKEGSILFMYVSIYIQ